MSFSRLNTLFERHRKIFDIAVPAFLCVILLAQLILSSRQLSQTFDEAVHLYSGYRYLKCGDLTFSPEHPPLAKLVAAAPLLKINPPADCSPFRGDTDDQFRMGLAWLYATDWHAELKSARLAISLFALGLCVAVWTATRRMLGFRAAVLAGLLLVFEPNILAHGALVATDVALTTTLFFFVFAFYLWASRPCVAYLALAGVSLGLTLLAKNSGVIAIAIMVLLAIANALLSQERERSLIRAVTKNLAGTGVVLMIAYVVIWSGYGMRFSAHPGSSKADTQASALPANSLAGRVLIAAEKNRLLPQAYLEGFASDPHSLLNVVSSEQTADPSARWFVLPRNLLIRCTIGFLALSLLAIAGLALAGKEYHRKILFMLAPAGLYAAGFIYASWNGGMRHMLPVLPFLIVLTSFGTIEVARRFHPMRYALPAFLFLHVASSLHASPNYLSYANELWGGPTQAFKHLAGEPDWGQSYLQAKTYLDQHPSEECWLISDVLTPANAYGLKCKVIGQMYPGLVPNQVNGTVLIGAFTYYSERPDQYEEVLPFKNTPPTDTIGGSAILVFRGRYDTRATASMSATILARQALMQGQLNEALRLSDYAIRISPGSIYGHFVHAAIMARLGDTSAAIRELEYDRGLILSQPSVTPVWLLEIEKSLRDLRG